MSTITSNINEVKNGCKTDKENSVFLGKTEVIAFWAITAISLVLIGITTWA